MRTRPESSRKRKITPPVQMGFVPRNTPPIGDKFASDKEIEQVFNENPDYETEEVFDYFIPEILEHDSRDEDIFIERIQKIERQIGRRK